MKPQKYVLKKDLVIPAGTVFECVDGSKRAFVSGNYEASIGLSKGTSGGLVYGIEPKDAECMDWFEPA